MRIDIKDQYIEQFEALLKSLPEDAVEVKKSLDEEIKKRSQEYRSGEMKTTPFMEGLDEIRESLVSRLS
ncbi:MAG: addiction module protein [Campylobacterales bacterium]